MQQALQAHQNNQLAEAETLYREVLRHEPANADALSLLGLVLGALGQHDEAIRCAEKAFHLDQTSALFAFQLGTVLTNAQKLPEGIAAFRIAVALKPTLAQGHYNLANALRATDQWTLAIASYRDAIRCMPNYAEAYNNLALSLVHEKLFEEALTAAKKSVTIEPRYGEGWRTLCNIAEQAKDYELARQAGENCVRLMPDSHFSWFGYGVALCRLDRYAEAVEVYKRALALKPERADIWDNLGQAYQSLNRLEDAEATFRRSIAAAGQTITDEGTRDIAEGEYGDRHWHLALLQLLRGKYKQGFDRYRARFESVGGLKRPKLSRPLWQGENLSGKTIIVMDEQGYGDTLMFCRYIPLLKQLGARVKFSLHPVLKPLFQSWPYVDEIILHDHAIGDYDFYCSVFDLPYRFGTTIETIPATTPYLPCPTPEAAMVLPQNGRKNIGVVWGGSPLHGNDTRRSIPLKIFASLFTDDRINFYSLNRDLKAGDEELLPTLPLTNLVPRIRDFGDAAQFIGQMDLIITCDTAMAHLSGGMGKPVWILLPFAPDWRWLTERSDSPWYPTAKLFRQATIGDWNSVIDVVRKVLSDFIQTNTKT
jgi:tetratricopeptide (TPR) repeat protein